MSTLTSFHHADRARITRTVASMSLAGYVIPSLPVAGAGLDGRLQAAELEIVQLLARDSLTPALLDRAEQLDDFIAFMPAATVDGAVLKLRRILCGRLGMFAGGTPFPRLNGADEAALRDVLRLVSREVR